MKKKRSFTKLYSIDCVFDENIPHKVITSNEAPKIIIAIPICFISAPLDFSTPELRIIIPTINKIRLPIINHRIIDCGIIFQPIISSRTTAIKPTEPNAVNKSPTFFKTTPPHKYPYFCK